MDNKQITTRSPLRYPGGKTRAVKKLLPLFPENTTTVLSPFLGGGSVELALTGREVAVHGVDNFTELATFWDVLTHHPEELADRIEELLGSVDKEKFTQMQKSLIDNEYTTDMKCAVNFFVVNRCSFSGATLSGGFSQSASTGRFTPSSVERIREFYNPLLTTSCGDAFTAIADTAHNYDVVFLDPPYALKGSASSLYGKRGDGHKGFDHEQLREVISETDMPFILTYNNTEYIRQLWDGYEQQETEWTYGMNNNRKGSSELIITYGL